MTLRAQDGQPSRLQHPDAFLLDVQGDIDIPVMVSTAMPIHSYYFPILSQHLAEHSIASCLYC